MAIMSSGKKPSRKHRKDDGDNSEKTSKKKRFPFRLPAEYATDPDRFEFWTVRVPAAMNLEDMQGCQIKNKEDCYVTSDSVASTSPTKFALHVGNGAENESLRMIIPRTQLNVDDDESDDDSNDEEDKKTLMVALSEGFTRHMNVVEHRETRTEQQLAPHPDEAPDAGSALRRAYTSVPQKTGLKRRWQPSGASSIPSDHFSNAIAQTARTSMNRRTTDVNMDEPSGEKQENNCKQEAETTSIDKVTEKRRHGRISREDHAIATDREAKRAAKKARKEEKKEKKEGKKAKKEKKDQTPS